MNTMALLFASSAGLVVIGLAMVLLLAASRRGSDTASERLDPRGQSSADAVQETGPWATLFAGPGQGLGRWLQDDNETLGSLMTRAGWRDERKRSLFYSLQFILPVVGAAGALLFTLAVSEAGPGMALLYVFAGFAIGLLLPRYLLRSAARRRQGRVRAEVPILVHMLVMLHDSGLSTRQAFHSMVRDGQRVLPELTTELRSVLRQLDAGADLAAALADMDRDLGVSELSSVLGLLRQVERFGGEVREPLLSALALIEERRTLSLRERVNQLAGRMTVVMVMFFFPALLLCVAGPAFTAIIFALRSATS